MRAKTATFALRIVLVCGLAAAGCVPAQTTNPAPGWPDRAPEYDEIASYLAAFLRYVTWPPPDTPANEPWRIGVLGQDPFGPMLDRVLVGKTLDQHRIEAVRAVSADQLAGCRIAFVNPASPAECAAALRAFAGKPVLTVIYLGNAPTPEPSGAVIELLLTDGRIRYLLNSEALAAQNLRPTPGLLENALRRPSAVNPVTPAAPTPPVAPPSTPPTA